MMKYGDGPGDIDKVSHLEDFGVSTHYVIV